MFRNLTCYLVGLSSLVSVLFVGASCGGGTDQTSPPVQQYQSLAIAPVAAIVRKGTVAGISGLGNRFIAVGRRSDGSADQSWDSSRPIASTTWSSSVPAVATIDLQGRFEPLSAGTTTISAKFGELTASTTLVVSDTASVLKAVEMQPGLPIVGPDGKAIGFHVQAVAKYDDYSERDITQEGIWVSSDTSAATVDSTGLVTYKSTTSFTVYFLYGLSYNSMRVVQQ